MTELQHLRAVELEDECAELRAEIAQLTNDLQECQSRWEGWRHEQARKDAEITRLQAALRDIQEGCRIGESHMRIDYIARQALSGTAEG